MNLATRPRPMDHASFRIGDGLCCGRRPRRYVTVTRATGGWATKAETFSLPLVERLRRKRTPNGLSRNVVEETSQQKFLSLRAPTTKSFFAFARASVERDPKFRRCFRFLPIRPQGKTDKDFYSPNSHARRITRAVNNEKEKTRLFKQVLVVW